MGETSLSLWHSDLRSGPVFSGSICAGRLRERGARTSKWTTYLSDSVRLPHLKCSHFSYKRRDHSAD